MALIRPRHWRKTAQAALLALAAGAMPLSAQELGAPEPDNDASVDMAPEPDMQDGVMPDDMLPDETMPGTESGMPIPLPAMGRPGGPVVVGDLGRLEGPVAGTLDDTHGGLGYEEWQSSDRATMETLLLSAPAATPSGAARLLLRKLLLTIAPPPPGRPA